MFGCGNLQSVWGSAPDPDRRIYPYPLAGRRPHAPSPLPLLKAHIGPYLHLPGEKSGYGPERSEVFVTSSMAFRC